MIYKHLLYPDQQKAIKEKILDILDLDSYNSTTLYELDNNTEKQQKLLDLLPDMKKFFSISSCAGIYRSEDTKRPMLSILRKILKTDYDIVSSDWRVRDPEGNLLYRTKRYYFHKKKV